MIFLLWIVFYLHYNQYLQPLLYNFPLYFLARSRQLQLEQYRMQLYIGQTGCTQRIRNREHTQAIRPNYDGHILKTEHCYFHLH